MEDIWNIPKLLTYLKLLDKEKFNEVSRTEHFM